MKIIIFLFTLVSFYTNNLLAQGEKSATDYYNKAVEYFNAKNYELAMASYSASINLDNNNAKAFLNRGYCALQTKQFENAINDFDESINLDASLSKAYLNKGYTLLLIGDYGKAIAVLTTQFHFTLQLASEATKTELDSDTAVSG